MIFSPTFDVKIVITDEGLAANGVTYYSVHIVHNAVSEYGVHAVLAYNQ
jgi:hypothetical protein